MKRLLTAALFAATAGLCACGGDEPHNTTDGGSDAGQDQTGQTLAVENDITEDTTWQTGNTYVLKKHIFVKNATLTVQPGVTIKGELGSSLVVTSTAKLEAEGTSQSPILMTSARPEGERAAGDWGGLVLLGNAAINVAGGTNAVEGFASSTDTRYGGTDDAHACGTLKYARIEFAGFELSPDNELNSLTVAGCGTGTTLDYIQVHKGADDGVEFFGGKAGIRHLVVTQPDDDGLDWDYGWQGKVQYLVIQQNQLVGNAGFESDSNKDAPDADPRSSPEIWNLTMIGSNAAKGTAGKTQLAMHLRRGTAARIHNAVIAYFTDGLIDVDGAASVAQFGAGNLYVKDSVFFQNGGQATAWPTEPADNDSGFDEGAQFMAAALNNAFADPKLQDPLNLAQPNFLPAGDSLLLSGGAMPGAGFDAAATFRGAFGAQDWTAGWTAFPPN